MNKTRPSIVLLPLLACLLAPLSLRADLSAPAPTRLACVGDSITYGAGLKDRRNDSYPAQLGRWLGTNWDVRNFGVSGATLLSKGNRPYVKRKEFGQALDFKPDVLVIMLGTNDSKHRTDGNNDDTIPDNWQYRSNFVGDYEALIAQFQKANPAVKVYVCDPTPCFPGFGGINDDTIHHDIIPLIHNVAKDTKASLIDLYDPMSSRKELFPDTVHPNVAGARLMAADVYTRLTGKEAPSQP